MTYSVFKRYFGFTTVGLAGCLAVTTAHAQLPMGAEVSVVKGSDISYDAQKGVFLDKSGNPVLPSPDSYKVIMPGQPGHTGAAATGAAAKANMFNSSKGASSSTNKSRSISSMPDSDNGGVSNYSPKGASSVSSSSATPENPNYDRAVIDKVESAPAILVTQPRTEITTSSRTEIGELQNVMATAIKKARELETALTKNQITSAAYSQKFEHEIKPPLEKFKLKLQARKQSVLTNSYYVRIIEEQLKLCDRLMNSLKIGKRYISSRHPADLKAHSLELEQVERSVPMIAVKYHVLDTQ